MWDQTSALLLTLAVEVPIAGLLARAIGANLRRAMFAALLASWVTHPVAWQLAAKLGSDDYRTGIALIEGAVVLAEAGIYRLLRCCSAWAAIGISTACNAASWLIGVLLLGG